MAVKVRTVIILIGMVEVLTKKGHREPSGVMEMFYVLFLVVVTKVYIYVKLQGAVNLRYMHFPVRVLYLNTNK